MSGAFWRKLLTVFAGCALLGAPGRLIAPEPGFASPFAPAAGFALAAVLICGPRMAWGVLAGSLGLNLGHLAYVTGGLNAADLFASAVVSVMATVQCLVLRAILVGRPWWTGMLVAEREILLTTGAILPAGAFITAAIGVGTLHLTGHLQTAELLVNGLVWWIGEAIGVNVGLILTFIIMAEPRNLWRSRLMVLGAPLILVSAVLLVLFHRTVAWKTAAARTQFEERAGAVFGDVAQQFELYGETVNALRAFWQSSELISEREFRDFTFAALVRRPAILKIEYAPLVRQADRPAFELAMQASSPAYQIRESDNRRVLGTAAVRQKYVPLMLVEPGATAADLIGYDLMSEPARRMAVEAALTADRTAMTPVLRFITGDGTPVVLLMIGVGKAELPPSLPVSTQAKGVVLIVVDVKRLVTEALGRQNLGLYGFRVEVPDQSAPESVAVTYGIASAPETVGELTWTGERLVFGRAFRLTLTTPMRGDASRQIWEPAGLLAASALFAMVVIWMLLIVSGRNLQVTLLVEQRTRERDLERANAEHSSKMASLGVMAGGVAHEVNSPLTVILGSCDQVRRSLADSLAANPKAAAALDRIETTSLRISSIIKALRAISRDDRADALAIVDLAEVVAQTTSLCAESLRQASILLETRALGQGPFLARARFAGLMQVLLNVIHNSRDALEGVAQKQIHIEYGGGRPYSFIRVSDNGPGIPPELRAKVMEPFFTTKALGKGTGLGLSVARGIMESVGGELVLLEQAAGASFEMRLPPMTS